MLPLQIQILLLTWHHQPPWHDGTVHKWNTRPVENTAFYLVGNEIKCRHQIRDAHTHTCKLTRLHSEVAMKCSSCPAAILLMVAHKTRVLLTAAPQLCIKMLLPGSSVSQKKKKIELVRFSNVPIFTFGWYTISQYWCMQAFFFYPILILVTQCMELTHYPLILWWLTWCIPWMNIVCRKLELHLNFILNILSCGLEIW